MVTVTIDIQDTLINGQIGEMAGFETMDSYVKKKLSQVLGSFSREECNVV